MKEIKIVHFADVHLGMENYGKIDPQTGLNSRIKDFTKSFDMIVDFVLKNNIDLVVFAGDAYKTRDPSPTIQKEFAHRIYKIAAANIPVAMVVGNHDFPGTTSKANTLEIFPTLSVPNIYTFKQESIRTIATKSGPIQVAGLPWFTRGQLLLKKEIMQKNTDQINNIATKKIVEKINYLSSLIKKELPAILIGHSSVEKAVYGSERQVSLGTELVIPLEVLRQSGFNAVFLGHLHKYQKITDRPPTFYSGSIERVDFGEEKETKGFILAKIISENNHFKVMDKFIKLPTRPFISIRVKINSEDTKPNDKILEKIKKYYLDEAIVKVIIEIPEEKSGEINETTIREALSKADFIAGINKEIQKGERVKIDQGFSDELANLDPIGLLEKYLISKKTSPKRIEALKKETLKLIEENI